MFSPVFSRHKIEWLFSKVDISISFFHVILHFTFFFPHLREISVRKSTHIKQLLSYLFSSGPALIKQLIFVCNSDLFHFCLTSPKWNFYLFPFPFKSVTSFYSSSKLNLPLAFSVKQKRKKLKKKKVFNFWRL